jgi:hypothetical protein
MMDINELIDIIKPYQSPISPYIADLAWRGISSDPEMFLADVSKVKSDLHPTGGDLTSLTKTIEIADKAGHRYRVTVEVLR